jgi:hypothetical protein
MMDRVFRAAQVTDSEGNYVGVNFMEITYQGFLQDKAQFYPDSGFEPLWMPDFLFPFQRSLTDWAIRKGRAAIFADCGLGKTPMQLVWAQNVVQKTNRPVMILTPLGVTAQTLREAEKFGIEADRTMNGKGQPLTHRTPIVVTNYERLHQWDPNDFAGCVCDESSILKAFTGARRREITEFMRRFPYRLLCSATPAPNDYVELGTSSQALGYLDYSDMLSRFFKNEEKMSEAERHGRRTREGVVIPKWVFKGHAEEPYFRWLCSWARACRMPSDLGFEDDGFILPELIEREHIVEASKLADGKLLHVAAVSFHEQLAERRLNMDVRCQKVAELVGTNGTQALVWCHLNQESETLADLIPGAAQTLQSDGDEEKEEKFLGFVDGSIRVLISKPRVAGFGLNFQHCHHQTFFPSHSFEQYYQGVARCRRFGQKHPVTVDVVTTPAERDVLKNLQRKQAQADRLFSRMIENMQRELNIERVNPFQTKEEVPSWL